MDEHIIYKITNVVNGKIYIGKTKKYYGATKYGIDRRLKKHIYDATKNKQQNKEKDCPRLYNAIRKYGGENFKTEELEITDSKNIDDKEIHYIKLYDSINRDIGYNIASGGKGRKVVSVSEDIRNKISKAQGKTNETNIIPYKNKKGEFIGYRVRRRDGTKQYEKYFTNQQFSVEENYIKAKEFLESIKNKTNEQYFNKESELPKNISYVYSKPDKNKIVGYGVSICSNGKKIHKSFQSKKEDLKVLLKNAITFRDEKLKTLSKKE